MENMDRPNQRDQKDVEDEWWENFRGKCITCIFAEKTNRNKEMMCMLGKAARDHGLGSRPGGSWNGTPVSKLFGCVYWKSSRERPARPILKKNEDKKNDSDCTPF